MAVTLTINGQNFNYPTRGNEGWGGPATDWAVAVTNGMLQKAGGLFQLTNNVDFGPNFGLISTSYRSRSSDIAQSGVLRLANGDLITFRNAANTGDLSLGVNSSNQLTFNGNALFPSAPLTASRALVSDNDGAVSVSSVTTTELERLSGVSSAVRGVSDTATLTNKTIDAGNNTLLNISNASIASNAAIEYTKLDLTASLVDADIASNAAIAYTKLDLNNSIVNADIASSAAIAGTKVVPSFGSQDIENNGKVSTDSLELKDSGSESTTLEAANTVSSSYTVKLPADPAASAGEAIVVTDITGSDIETAWGAAGDASWQMQDAGNGQIRFKAGARTVNGIVTDIPSDITTNATPVALTDDTLTVVDSSDGFLYVASDTVRVYTFYDIVNEEFAAIGNASDDDKWDYRNEDPDFNINLSQYVPIGYVDVTATANPGDITVDITNFPVGPWTTFNNVAAAEPWQDWSPALTPSGGSITVTGANHARYRRVGNTVEFYLKQSFTIATSPVTDISFTIPIPINNVGGASTNDQSIVGYGRAFIGTAIPFRPVYVISRNNSSTSFLIRLADSSSDVWNTGVNRHFSVFGFYEISPEDGYNPIAVAFPSINDLVQTKNLSANVTTNTTMSSLTVDVEVGKVYEVYINAAVEAVAIQSLVIQANNGATNLGLWQVGSRGTASTLHRSSRYIKPFRATSSTITFSSGNASATNIIRGDGTDFLTHVVVKEVPTAGIGVLLPKMQYFWSPGDLTGMSNGTIANHPNTLFLPKGSYAVHFTARPRIDFSAVPTFGQHRISLVDSEDTELAVSAAGIPRDDGNSLRGYTSALLDLSDWPGGTLTAQSRLLTSGGTITSYRINFASILVTRIQD